MVIRDPGGDPLQRVLQDAVRWTVEQDFRGHDPYDGLATRYAVLRRNRATRLLMVYLNKFSPLNLRRPLGIAPHTMPAGVAVVSRVLLRSDPQRYGVALARNVDYLLSKSLRTRYGHHCWNGTDFSVQMVNEYQPPDVPGVIGTAACTHFLLDYFERYPDRDDLGEVALSVRDFLLDTLLQEYEGSVFFRYKHSTQSL